MRLEFLRRHRIVQVAAAEYHACALAETGDLFTWGNGTYGTLGHGDDRSVIITEMASSKLVQMKVKNLLTWAPVEEAIMTDERGFEVHTYTSMGEEEGCFC